ncbi:hypothetical protein PTKIN_Ptkin15bG0033500 [Pterospermum kingtungense]
MENSVDFLKVLNDDLLVKILTTFEDSSDLVRFSAVSRSWQRFVIKNGLCKHLCLRIFPQLSRVDYVNELSDTAKGHAEAGSSNYMEWKALEREHRVYAFLAQHCLSFCVRKCISEAIIASSTDHYPEESIVNTLEPRDRVARRASYWSSKGESNPAVPEMLTYKLVSDLCVITEINIRPFQAKSVRFRMGHESCQDSGSDKFVWTYTSQEFPMAQENRLQTFRFPDPILCIGGILQVELLGRVLRHEMDGLFYICVSHVQVMGQPLSPAFGIQILEPSEQFVLEARSYTLPTLPEETEGEYEYEYDDEDEDEDEEEDEDME